MLAPVLEMCMSHDNILFIVEVNLSVYIHHKNKLTFQNVLNIVPIPVLDVWIRARHVSQSVF